MRQDFILRLVAILATAVVVLYGITQCSQIRKAEQDTRLEIARELTARSHERNDSFRRLFRNRTQTEQ